VLHIHNKKNNNKKTWKIKNIYFSKVSYCLPAQAVRLLTYGGARVTVFAGGLARIVQTFSSRYQRAFVISVSRPALAAQRTLLDENLAKHVKRKRKWV